MLWSRHNGYVASVSNACLKCLIYLLLYIESVESGCFKSRSGCCTCCNGVSTVCPKYFICFRRMWQMFHSDVTKVDLMFEWCSGTHLPQATSCSCWARVHACGSGGTWAVGTENKSRRHYYKNFNRGRQNGLTKTSITSASIYRSVNCYLPRWVKYPHRWKVLVWFW
jgi:hypothetical protein